MPPNYSAILGDPRMVEMLDGTGTRVADSCTFATSGAVPPRRIVSVGQELEARGVTTVIGSICQGAFTGPMSDILDRLTQRLTETCL
jgi:hypothetical protein